MERLERYAKRVLAAEHGCGSSRWRMANWRPTWTLPATFVSQLVRRALEQDEFLTSLAVVNTFTPLLDELERTLRARSTLEPATDRIGCQGS